LAELLDEGVGHGVDHDDPLGRHADLALVHERAEGGGLDGLVEVGVVQHEQRRLAAQLQQHGLEVLGAALGDDLAHGGRAGEVDAAHGRMVDHRADHFAAASRARW
jgi:hypothetical protein